MQIDTYQIKNHCLTVSYYKKILLIFFSTMIGFMAVFKPLITVNKKTLLSEQQECSYPESGCDTETDGETNKEDTEWDDKFYFTPYLLFRLPLSSVSLITFFYVSHLTEHFASISIPPPEILQY